MSPRDLLVKIAGMPRIRQVVLSGAIRDTITLFDDDIAAIEACLAEPDITDAQVHRFDKAMQDHWDAWCEATSADPRDGDQVRLDAIRAALTAMTKLETT